VATKTNKRTKQPRPRVVDVTKLRPVRLSPAAEALIAQLRALEANRAAR